MEVSRALPVGLHFQSKTLHIRCDEWLAFATNGGMIRRFN